MAQDRDYGTDALGDDETSRLLRKILSPAEAQSLVLPPPDHAPQSGPGESTPLTGNLAQPPSQATPSRSAAGWQDTSRPHPLPRKQRPTEAEIPGT